VDPDLGLQRSQHLTGAVANQLIEHRPAHGHRDACRGLGLFVDCLEHGHTFPNQRVNAGS